VRTERITLDVLRSSTTTAGELCVMSVLTTKMHKSPATRSDFCNFCLYLTPFVTVVSFPCCGVAQW